MSTPITKPEDVQPGDAVDYVKHGEMRSVTTQAVVVRATATGLNVRLPDGSEVRRAYTATVKSSGWGGGTSQHINFRKLTAHDLWARAQPSTGAVTWSRREGAVIKTEALRDCPLIVADEVKRLSDWLVLEPKSEASS